MLRVWCAVVAVCVTQIAGLATANDAKAVQLEHFPEDAEQQRFAGVNAVELLELGRREDAGALAAARETPVADRAGDRGRGGFYEVDEAVEGGGVGQQDGRHGHRHRQRSEEHRGHLCAHCFTTTTWSKIKKVRDQTG